MKRSRYIRLSVSAFIIVVLVATLIFVNHLKNADKITANSLSANELQDITKDETGIEMIKVDEYTIQLRGSARPQNDEISVEEAADIGVEALVKKYSIDVKNDVEMVFLDDIVTNTGKWSGHINLSDTEKYEFLIDGKDGSLEFINKNE